MMGRTVLATVLLLGVVLGVGCFPPAVVAEITDPVVATDKGLVRGRTFAGVDEYLGIPYARPPVGWLRWHAPQPATAWSGVRDAGGYGSRCAQLVNGRADRVYGEDCLYLNVFTPAAVPAGAALPVLVFVHGGGLESGAGDYADGSLIARTDHVVVVSLNYRLGAFGYLTLPGLTTPDHAGGNFGLLDQEAALRWTRANIRAFAGDARRVTVAGESAGGWSVCALLAAPGARGLFDRAIMQSGSCPARSPDAAAGAGVEFATRAGCPVSAPAALCLRTLPASTLVQAASSYTPRLAYGDSDLPIAPAVAIATGEFTRAPILVGVNRDEARTFTRGAAGWTERRYNEYLDHTYGVRATAIRHRYPWRAYPSPYTSAYALGAIETDSGAVDGIGGCPGRELAHQFTAAVPTYFYEFDDRNAPGLDRTPPGYRWGAGHAMELAYLWPTFGNGYPLSTELTPAQQELSHWMVRYWGAFIAVGDPDVAGQSHWPRYGKENSIMSLRQAHASITIDDSAYDTEHRCNLWSSTSSR